MTPTCLDVLRNLPFDRKPETWDSVTTEIDFTKLDPKVQASIKNLYCMPAKNSPLDLDESLPYHQFVVVIWKDQIFLVNTEGYIYARYVAKLVGI